MVSNSPRNITHGQGYRIAGILWQYLYCREYDSVDEVFTIEDEPISTTAINGINSACHTRVSFKTAYQASKRESIMEHHGNHQDQSPVEAYFIYYYAYRAIRTYTRIASPGSQTDARLKALAPAKHPIKLVTCKERDLGPSRKTKNPRNPVRGSKG